METAGNDFCIVKSPEEDKIYWQEKINLQSTSQLSKAAFCRENQISYNQFNYWVKRLGNKKNLISVKIKPETKKYPDELKVLGTIRLSHGHCLQIHSQEVICFILNGEKQP